MQPKSRLDMGNTAPTFALIDADGNAANLGEYLSRKVNRLLQSQSVDAAVHAR